MELFTSNRVHIVEVETVETESRQHKTRTLAAALPTRLPAEVGRS